ncbi:hypothetical protein DACRYDRAFT_20644 [Dacryopinax primogenitus]|uniref:Uncharacterized protein n=1 Tax=Dacryopinax primogenitus (strain DJM 731) TaxID=1858805 RepID=M5G8M4_DACPD|nr:uncharacterized protein DACRYDRAFT_20644 [Dacryopinax primogenitus]EJU05099.1 hypothetical protein DACRYDRAFT_20644 [Dacryopinax primogenitus]
MGGFWNGLSSYSCARCFEFFSFMILFSAVSGWVLGAGGGTLDRAPKTDWSPCRAHHYSSLGHLQEVRQIQPTLVWASVGVGLGARCRHPESDKRFLGEINPGRPIRLTTLRCSRQTGLRMGHSGFRHLFSRANLSTATLQGLRTGLLASWLYIRGNGMSYSRWNTL